MATHATTVAFLCDQLASVSPVQARKMFGEYALYCDGLVVALVCDDQLFVKITPPGRDFVGALYETGQPYPGAKPWLLIEAEKWEDPTWLSQLVQITAAALPPPKLSKRQHNQWQ